MHENCERCGLWKDCNTPFMKSYGSEEPLVMVVGEVPSYADDKAGKPFTDEAGMLLLSTLLDSGYDFDDIRYTNVIKCRPAKGKVSKRAQNYCKHFVLEEIEEYNPNLVFLMGNSPLNAILLKSGITQWNGVVVDRGEQIYVPLYHPNYVKNNTNVVAEWLNGMDKGLAAITKGIDKKDFQRYYPLTMDEVYEMENFLLSQELVSYDTETGHLDPWHEINCIPCVSFAAGDRTYGLPLDHEDSPWSDNEYAEILDILGNILTHKNVKLIGHNMKYDQKHTRYMLDIDYDTWSDTMIVSHMLDSRKGIHSLKRLAGLHIGMYNYDEPLEEYKRQHKEADPKRGGSYANIPLDVLLPYAALDTEATLKLHHKLYPKLNDKQKDFYHEVVIPASNVLADMEYNGNSVDDYIADRYFTIYSHVQERLYNHILESNDVTRTAKHFQRVENKKMIERLPDGASYEFTATHLEYTVEVTNNKGVSRIRNGKRKRTFIEFNPNSHYHLRHLYYDELGLPITELTDTGEPSTKADVVKPYIKKYKIVDLITHYKLLTKMLGTYLGPASGRSKDKKKYWKSGDGRVRSTYNLQGTVTGRLSSSDPNMQNIPTPEKEADARPLSVIVNLPIKNIFTKTFEDGVLMAVDYSGMELRVFASLANCEPMLEIHRSGADFHSMVSILAQTGRAVSDISKEETQRYKHEYPEIRYRYKWTNWTLLYGGTEYTLMSLYGMSEYEAKSTVASYYEKFPEVLEFRNWCVDFGKTNGYIESPFGRQEQLHYINDNDRGKQNKDKRSAVNMPVQSSASDILLCALIVIHDKMRARGLRTMLVNTVHDSIVFDVPGDEIDEVAALCVEVMENITEYKSEYFPSIDFSWLKSPLVADVEVGTHYGTEISYKEWLENGRRF